MSHTEGQIKLNGKRDGLFRIGHGDAGIPIANAFTEANAARLCLCWNEHDQLVQTLAGLVKWLDDSGLAETKRGGSPPFTFGGDEFEVVTTARAVLARLKEQSK